MSEILTKINNYGWGNLASIAGFFLGLVGFGFTLYGVSKSRTAAESASDAAQDARNTIMQAETISNFSSAVTVMEEVKRLHRAEAWEILPDRYSYLRKALISIISSSSDLSEDHRSLLQSAVVQFRELENNVETHLATKKANLNAARLNKIVTTQIDKLDEVLNFIKVK